MQPEAPARGVRTGAGGCTSALIGGGELHRFAVTPRAAPGDAFRRARSLHLPASALPDLIDAFVGAGFGQSVGEPGQCGLEARGEALDDGAFEFSLETSPPVSVALAIQVRGGAVWQLVGLITRRSQVRILPPLPMRKAPVPGAGYGSPFRGVFLWQQGKPPDGVA